jgi:hypothetical protein
MPAIIGSCWPRDICTGDCLARCCGGSGRCRSQRAEARRVQQSSGAKKGLKGRSGVREMPRNGSSSRLQVSANQADGLPGGDEINLLTSEGLWVYKLPIREIKWKSQFHCFPHRACAGKSTNANALLHRLLDTSRRHVTLLDGDSVRVYRDRRHTSLSSRLA